MLCENCEKVILKSIQRKYYKTVMNIEMGQEININNKYQANITESQIPVKTKEIKEDKSKEQTSEKKLMIFD